MGLMHDSPHRNNGGAALANAVTTEKVDLLFASLPYRILPEAQVPVYQEMARREAEFYSQLEAAGFELDFGVNGSSLFLKYLRRGSGYYIDVGASQLIIDARVKLKNGQRWPRPPATPW
jgi:putative flavoprotein involved in K+ transport